MSDYKLTPEEVKQIAEMEKETEDFFNSIDEDNCINGVPVTGANIYWHGKAKYRIWNMGRSFY